VVHDVQKCSEREFWSCGSTVVYPLVNGYRLVNMIVNPWQAKMSSRYIYTGNILFYLVGLILNVYNTSTAFHNMFLYFWDG
jgi:hypothetical protein